VLAACAPDGNVERGQGPSCCLVMAARGPAVQATSDTVQDAHVVSHEHTEAKSGGRRRPVFSQHFRSQVAQDDPFGDPHSVERGTHWKTATGRCFILRASGGVMSTFDRLTLEPRRTTGGKLVEFGIGRRPVNQDDRRA